MMYPFSNQTLLNLTMEFTHFFFPTFICINQLFLLLLVGEDFKLESVSLAGPLTLTKLIKVNFYLWFLSYLCPSPVNATKHVTFIHTTSIS